MNKASLSIILITPVESVQILYYSDLSVSSAVCEFSLYQLVSLYCLVVPCSSGNTICIGSSNGLFKLMHAQSPL